VSHPSLEFLGVGPEDENFYRVLLRTGGADPRRLGRHCGMDEDEVRVLWKPASCLASSCEQRVARRS
jgi:hypothetical protein